MCYNHEWYFSHFFASMRCQEYQHVIPTFFFLRFCSLEGNLPVARLYLTSLLVDFVKVNGTVICLSVTVLELENTKPRKGFNHCFSVEKRLQSWLEYVFLWWRTHPYNAWHLSSPVSGHQKAVATLNHFDDPRLPHILKYPLRIQLGHGLRSSQHVKFVDVQRCSIVHITQ